MSSWRRPLSFLAAIALFTLILAQTDAVRVEQPSVRQATPWQGPRGIQLTMQDLAGSVPTVEVRAPRQAIEIEEEEEQKRASADRNTPRDVLSEVPYQFQGILPRAQRVTQSFTAYVGNGVPDTMGAIGPSQFLLVINNRIKTIDKRTGLGDGVIDQSLAAFFSPAGTGAYDPNVRYDRRANKWIVGALSNPGTSNGSNRLMFAISDSGILARTTRWTFHQFQFDAAEPVDSVGCSGDFPAWGEDAIALYIAAGAIQCPAGTERRVSLFVIRKESLFGTGPIVVSTFRNAQLQGTTPANDPDSGGGTGYFMSQQMVCRVVNAADSPRLLPCVTISGGRLFSYFDDGVRHRGNNEESGSRTNGAGRLNTPVGAGRTPMVRQGHLWYAMSIGVDNTGQIYWINEIPRNTRLGIAWVEVTDIDSDRPRLVASGRVFTPSANNDVDQRNYWMPAVAISGQGHMLIGASAAGTNEYVNAVAIGRLAGDPPGMFRDPSLYTEATAAYNADDSRWSGSPRGARRWGDYSHTLVDPCDDMTMWTVQQYTAETDKWGIAVARMAAPPPVTPTSATPNSVASNQDHVEVELKGTATDGAAFFDPGSGFECRLRVNIPGASVNAVRVVNPTTLSLSLSTRGVTPGPLDITITNPDGQSVVAAGVVRVQ